VINYLIGIDPGKNTGLAVWNIAQKRLEIVHTCGIIEAMGLVYDFLALGHKVKLRVEDARLRTWFGETGREKLQGAGSIKRDCSIWEEFCKFHSIKFDPVKPAAGATKWTDHYFKRVTGWKGRTSEHSRDAVCLVFGAKS
jgi:hypothetical protein